MTRFLRASQKSLKFLEQLTKAFAGRSSAIQLVQRGINSIALNDSAQQVKLRPTWGVFRFPEAFI
jgi:hypothetical protein